LSLLEEARGSHRRAPPGLRSAMSPDALEIGTHRMLAKLLPSNPQNADTHPSEFKFLS